MSACFKSSMISRISFRHRINHITVSPPLHKRFQDKKALYQVSRTSIMASSVGHFAMLKPVTDKARLMVNRAVSYMEESKDQSHLKYLKFSVRDMTPAAELSDITDESDFDSSPEEAGLQSLRTASYQLSMQKDELPNNPKQGWSVGRGWSKTLGEPPTGADLLLANPRDSLGRRIAPVHFLIQVHPKSGALLITSVSPKRSLEYFENGIWHKLVQPPEKSPVPPNYVTAPRPELRI